MFTMQDKNIRALLENQRLYQEFKHLDLDPDEIWEYDTEDLELKNNQLKYLLGFTRSYLKHCSRQVMEISGFMFPPVYPGISPESDWYRFERWTRGESVRETIRAQLPEEFEVRPAEHLSDEALPAELDRLIDALAEKGYYVDLHQLPDRLVYESVLEWIGEEIELCPNGGWHLDGCTGYCPDCIQRPWCDTGQKICWPEDEDAGMMHLPDAVKKYVSASPVSLTLLLRDEVREDEDDFEYDENEENQEGLSAFGEN